VSYPICATIQSKCGECRTDASISESTYPLASVSKLQIHYTSYSNYQAVITTLQTFQQTVVPWFLFSTSTVIYAAII